MPSRARVAGAASTGAAAIRKRFRPPQGRCQKRELRLCDSDHRKGLCDFREHHRSFWLFLPSSENSIGHRCRLRWLPGCCRTGSETAAISVQPLFLRFGKRFDLKALLLLFCYLTLRFVALIAIRLSFGCCMLRLELLRLLRKWLRTEVLVAGILIVDFELRRKELLRRLDYGFAF